MNKKEIKDDIISNIELDLEDTLFYMPGETIKGVIKLNPKIKLNLNKLHFNLKLLQYEFWEYVNTEIKDFKNVYKTEIKSKSYEYYLKDAEKSKYKNNVKTGELTFIVLEKEEKEKLITIPFEFKIEKNDKKLQPTFQYKNEEYFLGIRHLLIVNCEEYNSSNYVGLFIGKEKDEEHDKSKKENYKFITGIKFIDVQINYNTQALYFGEKTDIKLDIKSKHILKKDMKIIQSLYRKIEWVGYFKNSLIDKMILDEQKDINKSDKSGFGSKELLPIGPNFDDIYYDGDEDDDLIVLYYLMVFPLQILGFGFIKSLIGVGGGIIGGVAGGIMGGFIGAPGGAAVGFYMGASNGLIPTIGFAEEESNHNLLLNNTNLNNKEQNNDELNELFKKFVLFKDDKIVGFIKFKDNITPPVNGYYFNCNFNLKIELTVKDIIFDHYRPIKDQIYFYDGVNYIKNMKQLLNINKIKKYNNNNA